MQRLARFGIAVAWVLIGQITGRRGPPGAPYEVAYTVRLKSSMPTSASPVGRRDPERVKSLASF